MTDVSALPTLEAAHVETVQASTTLALTQQVLSILQQQHGYDAPMGNGSDSRDGQR